MVPLATPALFATSSRRVAAKPRAVNSSRPAAMIAARRCAARAARFRGLAVLPVCADAPAPALPAEDRQLAEFATALLRRWDFAAFLETIMTDQSVIIKIEFCPSGQSGVMQAI